ncbi:MAG TPA: sigma factor-like helix-turn-helix DNA-binding protein [Candidatus Binatia bacterium]|nr:sigma factor-like helix-turn-helix DNA-binding protein [Candidatus Binatia bacterium]
MITAAVNVPAMSGEFAELVAEHLDDLVTYAAHLVGDAESAVELTAGGVHHAARYPPVRLQADGRAALYRAVTRACRAGQRFPPRPRGPARLWHRNHPPFEIEFRGGDVASRMNTVKRALMTLPFERRAALLLRGVAQLRYAEIARALECSPEAAARLIAAARREFDTIYREIAL